MPATLGNHISTLKGFAFKSKWYCAAGTPIVRVSDFSDDAVDTANLTYIPEEMAIEYERYRLTTGDVVIQTVGSWLNNPQSVVGKAIRVPSEASGALLNQNAVRLDPTEDLDKTFLFYLLRNNLFKNYIVGCAQGAASQASITLEAIRNFTFELPVLPVQRKIADVLSAYDDLIEVNARRIRVLETMAQSVYREWFGKVDENSLPEGWQTITIGDIAEVKGGKRLPKDRGVLDEITEHPYLRVRDFTERGLRRDDIKYIDEQTFRTVKNYIITDEDIYISIAGTIGRVGIVPKDLSNSNLTENAAKICNIKPTVNKHYLLHFLRSQDGQGQIMSRVAGTSQPKLALFRIKEIHLFIPPQDIMDKVSSILVGFADFVELLEKKNANLRRTRDLLLPRLVSGEVGVEENAE